MYMYIYIYIYMCIYTYIYIYTYPVGCARNRHQAIGEVQTRRRSILKVAIPS